MYIYAYFRYHESDTWEYDSLDIARRVARGHNESGEAYPLAIYDEESKTLHVPVMQIIGESTD